MMDHIYSYHIFTKMISMEYRASLLDTRVILAVHAVNPSALSALNDPIGNPNVPIINQRQAYFILISTLCPILLVSAFNSR